MIWKLKKFNSLIFENLLASRRCLITRKAIFRYKRTPERENILDGSFFVFARRYTHRQLSAQKHKSHSLLFGDLTSCVCPPIYIGSTGATWLAGINGSPFLSQFWIFGLGRQVFSGNQWCVSLFIASPSMALTELSKTTFNVTFMIGLEIIMLNMLSLKNTFLFHNDPSIS